MFIPKEQLGLSSSVTDFKISGETAMAQAGTSEKNCVVLYWLVLYTCDPITSSFSCVVLVASYTRGPITSFLKKPFLVKLHSLPSFMLELLNHAQQTESMLRQMGGKKCLCSCKTKQSPQRQTASQPCPATSCWNIGANYKPIAANPNMHASMLEAADFVLCTMHPKESFTPAQIPMFFLGPAGDAPASKPHLVYFFIFLGLAISLQKVKDTTQLILVHQDQKICWCRSLPRAQDGNIGGANGDFNHLFSLELLLAIAHELVVPLLPQLIESGGIGEGMAFQSASANQPGNQRGAALNLQVVLVIDVLQCLSYPINSNAINQQGKIVLAWWKHLASNRQTSPSQ